MNSDMQNWNNDDRSHSAISVCTDTSPQDNSATNHFNYAKDIYISFSGINVTVAVVLSFPRCFRNELSIT